MKFTFGDYEIEIKAKLNNCEQHYNSHDTMAVMNEIVIMASASAELHKMLNCNAIAQHHDMIHGSIYQQLDRKGLYKHLGI